MKYTEAEIAALVVAYLEECGHDVYQEVEVRGGIADIVCLVGAGREVWDIEVKTGWSLDLLEQCVERKRVAHRVFAAVPKARSNHAHLFRECGIGTFIVRMGDQFVPDRVELEGDWMPRRTSPRPIFGRELRERLCEGHKTHAKAGAPSAAGRYSPWRQTCDGVAHEVRQRPGATLKEILQAVKTHYASPAVARSSLAKWITKGVVPGVEGKIEDGKLRLYPKDAA
jgi:hypothetical protein